MVGFIGAGKVGVSLGRYFCEKGVSVSGYFSKTEQSALLAAEFTQSKSFCSLGELVNDSDIIFVTTQDSVIAQVWGQLKYTDICNKIICHCSGLLSSDVFAGRGAFSCCGYSVHPLLAVNDKFSSYKELENAPFIIEGDAQKKTEIYSLFNKCGNKVLTVSPENKPRYHAAAVIAGNLTIGLAQVAAEELNRCGISDKEAVEILVPFMLSNIMHIGTKGFEKSLTGPVERGDLMTVKEHLSVLSDDNCEIYKKLSLKILETAKKKNPEREYCDMEEVLK